CADAFDAANKTPTSTPDDPGNAILERMLFVHPFEKNRDEVLRDLPAVVLLVMRHPDDLLTNDVAEEHGAECENRVPRLHFAKSTFAHSAGNVVECGLFHAKL